MGQPACGEARDGGADSGRQGPAAAQAIAAQEGEEELGGGSARSGFSHVRELDIPQPGLSPTQSCSQVPSTQSPPQPCPQPLLAIRATPASRATAS